MPTQAAPSRRKDFPGISPDWYLLSSLVWLADRRARLKLVNLDEDDDDDLAGDYEILEAKRAVGDSVTED